MKAYLVTVYKRTYYAYECYNEEGNYIKVWEKKENESKRM